MPLTDSDIDTVLDQYGFEVGPEDRPMFREAARDMRAMCEHVRVLASETDTFQLFSLAWSKPEERP